ncbi:MAG: nucleotidyl transferase AbiEii/AbiGii toxin family protein [Deltaproteobacteria bacterium]|nr:nucleotidyl transferase AbiEii/AbiGii toxin family protein [Deltaproteobacteria bacterium]
MKSAIESMLDKYPRHSLGDHLNALREILQEIVLCGLWRAKFYERAAFYGGTALRVLYGLDRFSEDLDFSLLHPGDAFDLTPYCAAIEEELAAWGFPARVEVKRKRVQSTIASAFLKANTRELLLTVEADAVARVVHTQRQLKIKVEVDTDPPSDFTTETLFLLQPIPFSVKAFSPASLFAGKMHAVLCRRWKTRVKGRDWYDLVWSVGRGIPLDLGHLEARMRQSGHYVDDGPLDEATFRAMLVARIETLDINGARAEVERFLVNPSSVIVWSRAFFMAIAERIAIQTS